MTCADCDTELDYIKRDPQDFVLDWSQTISKFFRHIQQVGRDSIWYFSNNANGNGWQTGCILYYEAIRFGRATKTCSLDQQLLGVQYNQMRLSGRHFDSHLDDSLSNVNYGSLGLHTSVETALNRYNWIPPMGWNLDLKFRSSEPRAAAKSQATRFKNNKNKLTFIRRQFQCRSYII